MNPMSRDAMSIYFWRIMCVGELNMMLYKNISI